jgi:hypothetical protein
MSKKINDVLQSYLQKNHDEQILPFEINKILSEHNLENVQNKFENKTTTSINNEIYNAINGLECFFERTTVLAEEKPKLNFPANSFGRFPENWYSPSLRSCESLNFSDDLLNSFFIEIKKELCKKMIGFQYIYQINDFLLGRTIKLIRIEDGKFIFAGILLSIDFTNNGTILLCKVFPKGKPLNYNFEKYLFFQKLNKDEEIILSIQDYLQR